MDAPKRKQIFWKGIPQLDFDVMDVQNRYGLDGIDPNKTEFKLQVIKKISTPNI
jgi:hypothetical protein